MADSDHSSPYLSWMQIPEQLRAPILVMGFHGWPNAGSVSSDTLYYLTQALRPKLAARLDEETFTNYTSDRPIAQIEDGIIHELDAGVSELTYWKNSHGEHDLLLFLGKEPSFRWNVYSTIFVDVIHRLRVRKVFTIGGVQDTVSHASTALITVVGSSNSVLEEMTQLGYGVRPSEYYGPVSIHSHLVKTFSEVGIDATSIWGHVPAYLEKSPRVVARIIGILNRLVGLRCSTEVLDEKSQELDRKINEALAKDPNLKQFVESIGGPKNPRNNAKGNEKIIRLDDFVKRDHNKDPDI